ncbi:SAC domain-containing protein [Forsythia ovata]|uniref:SAC domain-containing protein n=1 Tax=Forsythia ovata TaxID=205694 RepID=A0ABD1WPF3_9LAMI
MATLVQRVHEKVGSLSIQPEIEPWRNAVVGIVLGVSTSFQNMLKHLKRGVNKKERVANDVETEKIIFEDVPEGSQCKLVLLSRIVAQYHYSVSKRDQHYGVTRLHFKNLVERYGKPVVVLNLIKTNENKPRESILLTEFANAIELINKDLSEKNFLKFLHLDLHRHSQSVPTCNPAVKSPMFQKGVLTTNCIDCLDRTNVAQYTYGLAALGHQMRALGVSTSTKIDLDDPLADELKGLYERMGDTLAHQYGGSAAHNKVSEPDKWGYLADWKKVCLLLWNRTNVSALMIFPTNSNAMFNNTALHLPRFVETLLLIRKLHENGLQGNVQYFFSISSLFSILDKKTTPHLAVLPSEKHIDMKSGGQIYEYLHQMELS